MLTKAMQFCLPAAAKVENISNMVEFKQDVYRAAGSTVEARKSKCAQLGGHLKVFISQGIDVLLVFVICCLKSTMYINIYITKQACMVIVSILLRLKV